MTSPTAERTVQILDFLTTHPGRGFTLSELSRQLRLSKTTAHKILATLTNRALVIRNPVTFEYRLGPALIPMGTVAERNFMALSLAQAEAQRLAEDHDAECFIVMTTGDELLNVGYAGVPGPLSTTFREGQRLPLTPPIGTLVLAWTSEQSIEAWLDRLSPELTNAERTRYRDAVELVRRRGYSVGMRVPKLDEFHEIYATADLNTPEGRRELSLAFARFTHEANVLPNEELPPDTEISGVAAPVFAPDRTMLFAICIAGTGYHAHDIPALSRAVMRAAGRVMAAIDGQHPSPSRTRPAPSAGPASRSA
jgi:DNA-binding IclR family transcriptional regulator